MEKILIIDGESGLLVVRNVIKANESEARRLCNRYNFIFDNVQWSEVREIDITI